MGTWRRSIMLAVVLMVAGSALAKGNPHGQPGPMQCPSDVAAALAERCPCDGQPNHGRYVSCVARFRNALRKAGCSGDALQSLTRCAARSTCGKAGVVVCCVPSTGTCDDPMPGDSVAQGVCSNDHALACDTSADCSAMTGRLANDEASCTSAGGTSAGSGSVCTACTTTTTSTISTSSTTTSTVP